MMKSEWLLSGMSLLFIVVLTADVQRALSATSAHNIVTIETDYLRYEVNNRGDNLQFVDKRTGEDYCKHQPVSKFAYVTRKGQRYEASSVVFEKGRMTIMFGRSQISVLLAVSIENHFIVFEVLAISDKDVEELTFVDISLTNEAQTSSVFTGCVLALNLKTRVKEFPGPNNRLKATSFSRFGITGAKAAIVGCQPSELRDIIKEAVSEANELPHSPLGGPWAVESVINRDSYLFNFSDLTEKTVDAWIELAMQLGVKKINMHGGNSFRFGDLQLNKQMYPDGRRSVKAVIDRLHSAGLKVGLQSYSFLIDKQSEWVTPIPDKRLAKDASFTLAESIGPDDTIVPINERIHGTAADDSRAGEKSTLQIDDELVIYTGFTEGERNIFTGYKRGAYGTKATSHNSGTRVYHLKETYGCFVPDNDSTLFTEVAARLAGLYNECGFDTLYFDGLDGSGVSAGEEYAWHYMPKFVFEVCRRLDKPAQMEMSCLSHHLWYVRSCAEAWDYPSRGYKRFIDLHCKADEKWVERFLPGHLGWWRLNTQFDVQTERTFSDDVEYLCSKALGYNYSLSFMGVKPQDIRQNDYIRKLAGIIKQYETLRLSDYFGERIKAKIRQQGAEVKLEQNSDGRWEFHPASYDRHKVEDDNGVTNIWSVHNSFAPQQIGLRIEALMSAGPYDAPNNPILVDFASESGFRRGQVAVDMDLQLLASSIQPKIGLTSGQLVASNKGAQTQRWAEMKKKFSPVMDVRNQQATGVWVYGDGQGEVLNFQLSSSAEGAYALADHYLIVDFKGWKYFELIEPEGHRLGDYLWPYCTSYLMPIYRFSVDYARVESVSLWCNNVPLGKTIHCHVSPVKALPLIQARLINPSITVNNKILTFPVELPSGYFLEFNSMSDCNVYDNRGLLAGQVKPQGDMPVLKTGINQIKFDCGINPQVRPRAYVTVISHSATPIE